MSALDKAFIKAYTRDPSPPAAGTDDLPQGLAPSPYVDWYETVPSAPPDGPYAGGLVYRFDDALATAQAVRFAPHAAFPASPGSSDAAYVAPDQAPDVSAPPAAGAAEDLSAATPGGAAPQSAWADAAVAGKLAVFPPPSSPQAVSQQAEAVPDRPAPVSECSPAGNAQNTSAATLPGPTAVEPQQALKLRTIFSTADTDGRAGADAAFSPDWEVDRLAWPPICERLLETEQRYFRSVGQRLKAATQDGHHVVLITGARRGEGRTTLALCLARCAAGAGVPTALVDADLKNPQIGSRLGIETPCSWREVVTGKSPLSEAAVSSLEDHLTLFPLIRAEDDDVAAGDPSCMAVLQSIARHYPLVIVDMGPLGSDGGHLFATDADCPIDTAIVVRDLRNTTEKKAVATAEALLRGGVPAVGIAENFRAADGAA